MIYQSFNSHIRYNYVPKLYTDFDFVEHLHSDFEIICVLEGSTVLTVGEEDVPLSKGAFALVLSNQIHSYRTPVSSRVWVGVFAEDYVRDFAAEMKDKQGKNIRFCCDETVRAFVFQYMIFAQNPTRNQLSACLTILCDQYQKNNVFTKIKRARGNYLYDILSYISIHYTEDISLSTAANALHINMNYLSRYFHKNIAMNFTDFVNHYRVSHAQALLAKDLDIADISYECGFQSIRTFNRVFKEITGQTPRDYRRALVQK